MEKKVMNIEAAATMKEICRALELISHLKDYICPLIQAKKEMDQATILFQEIMSSLSQSISTLDSIATAHQHDPKKMNRIHQENMTTIVKNRSVNDSTTVVTTRPFCDGYQWQKYGEKDIKNSEFRRTYYKCINEECKARKKVQQQDKDEPSKYMVKYDMQRTCNNIVPETNNQNLFTMDFSTSTSTINFGAILESSSFMMNNIQQEKTLSATSDDQFKIKHTVNHENTSVAKAVHDDESIVDNMAGQFSPLTPSLLDFDENDNAWELLKLMDDELASSADDAIPF